MERQRNQPSSSEDSFENYYLQDHYLEDIYIIPGCKDPTLKTQMNNVLNSKKSGEIEEDEVGNGYFRYLNKTANSKKFKNPRSVSRPSPSPDSGYSSEKSSRAVSTVNLMDYIKQNCWKVTGKRGRDATVLHVLPGYCTCSYLSPFSSKGLGLKESTMKGVNQGKELGGFLMKRKFDEYVETDDEDSLDSSDREKDLISDDKIKALHDNEPDQNPVENPMSSEDLESNGISKDKKKLVKIVLAPSGENKEKKKLIKIVFGPSGEKPTADSEGEEPKSSKESQRKGSDDSKIGAKREKIGDNNQEKEKRLKMMSQAKELGGFLFKNGKVDEHVETENQDSSDDDSLGSRPQEFDVEDGDHNQNPNQGSEKRGSDDPICGLRFKSFRALGGHRSNHTRSERVGDDNQIKKKRLEILSQSPELEGFLFKKRKKDEHVETENQDSSNDDKFKSLVNKESDLKKTDHTLLLPNPKCSDDSSGSRPQNPTSSEEYDVKYIDQNQHPNPNSSDQSITRIVIPPRAEKPAADLRREEPKSSQKSETNGSENTKEYECSLCGKKFKSFRALGGHKSNHTIRVRTEIAGDDNHVNKKIKMDKRSSGREEVEESHGCFVCEKSFKTSKQLKMHERCHGLNAGSHDQISQSQSTPSSVRVFDLNQPARAEDSDPSCPF